MNTSNCGDTVKTHWLQRENKTSLGVKAAKAEKTMCMA